MSADGSTYVLDQYPDSSALIGGSANYPLSFPHPVGVVSQTGYGWPQTIHYTGSPITAMVYSPSDVRYDKNTLPPIDIFNGMYRPAASLIQPASAISTLPPRQYQPVPWWKYAIIGGIGVVAAALLILYFW